MLGQIPDGEEAYREAPHDFQKRQMKNYIQRLIPDGKEEVFCDLEERI